MFQEHNCRYSNQSQVERDDQSWQFKSIRQNCLVDISLDDKNEAVDDDRVDVEKNVLV